MKIIDGKKAREALLPALEQRISRFKKPLTLAIIQVGEKPDSTVYINAKKKFATKIGVNAKHIQAPENIEEKKLIQIIEECNADPNIQGIIIQLPLPQHLNKDLVIDTIKPCKDADGLTATNVKGWTEGNSDAILPATARGVRDLLSFYNISLMNKKIVVVGRSMLVGKPIAFMCMTLNGDATVTICHSKTKNLEDETKTADILIVATGNPKLIGTKHVRAGQIIVDVGINALQLPDIDDGKRHLVGDVDFDAVKDIVEAITPVPGGVGPMTVLSLFENLVDLANNQ